MNEHIIRLKHNFETLTLHFSINYSSITQKMLESPTASLGRKLEVYSLSLLSLPFYFAGYLEGRKLQTPSLIPSPGFSSS